MKGARVSIYILFLITAVWAARCPTASAEEPTEATRVRILLVIHTNGEVAGKECGFALDGQAMRRVLEANLKKQGLQDRYTLDLLSGDNVTTAKVLGYYRNLKTKSSEALVFFYSGHGILNSNHEHVLTMNDRALRRTELLTSMARHDPRLLVLLSSSCANLPGEAAKNDPAGKTSDEETPRISPPPTVREGDGLVLRQLFFQQQGVVDINAARVAEFGWGHPDHGGTFFTVALTQLLGGAVSRVDRNKDNVVEWHEFYTALRSHTARLASSHGNEQNTMAYSMPAPLRGATSTVASAPAPAPRATK